jgi:hypothetical protein
MAPLKSNDIIQVCTARNQGILLKIVAATLFSDQRLAMVATWFPARRRRAFFRVGRGLLAVLARRRCTLHHILS